MNDTKKENRPVAGTTERAAESDFAGHIPNFDFTTDTSKRQEQEFTLISDLLHPGRENGLTRHDLAKITGLDEREIRRKIHAERKHGIPIIANCKDGYYLPENLQDIQLFARSMIHRAGEILAVARAAERAAAEAEGQSSFDGW